MSVLSEKRKQYTPYIPASLFRNPHATSLFANDLMKGL